MSIPSKFGWFLLIRSKVTAWTRCNRQLDGQTDRRMDGWTDRGTDGRMDQLMTIPLRPYGLGLKNRNWYRTHLRQSYMLDSMHRLEISKIIPYFTLLVWVNSEMKSGISTAEKMDSCYVTQFFFSSARITYDRLNVVCAIETLATNRVRNKIFSVEVRLCTF